MFDFIVVGGGSAGCVVANRLSEDGTQSVLLVEAGGSANRADVLVPGLATRLMGNPRWDWRYQAEPDPSRLGRVDAWPAGKVLGGGSSINGMVYLRGNRGDYDRWASNGAQGWSYDECLPYFIKCESNERFRDAWHGQSGPLHISDVRVDHPLNQMLIDACVAAGIPANPDVNGASQLGVGRMQSNQYGGMRDSTARAYLKPAAQRKNLRVLTNALARRILLVRDRAVGVEIAHDGGVEELRARREVILCAGTIATPKILMLSGIGPRAELSRHNIDCHTTLEGVGANLQEHPGVNIEFELSIETLSAVGQSRTRMAVAALNYLLTRRGLVSSPIAHVVGFFKTSPGEEWPDIQLHFAPFAFDFIDGRPALSKSNRVNVAINVCRPESRGQIRLRSADPTAPPIIDHALLGSQRDIERLAAGGRKLQEVFGQSPLREVCQRRVAPTLAVQTADQWTDYLRGHAMLMFHPVGTCRMGTDDLAVVDPLLRVRGVQGLRVADASIMPSLPSANTNGPTIMLAERASDIIRG